MPLENVVKLIRGPADSVVQLQVHSSDSNEPVSIPLVREKMDLTRRAKATDTFLTVIGPTGLNVLKLAPASTAAMLPSAAADPLPRLPRLRGGGPRLIRAERSAASPKPAALRSATM